MIVIEDRFEEMFDILPLMSNANSSTTNDFKVSFGVGDDKELMSYLIANKNKNVYPLIWLIQPYIEKHSKSKVELSNIQFILAVETNIQMLNKERLDSTFKNVLIPLYDNVIQLFTKSNIFNFDEYHDVLKKPNYYNEKLPGVRESLKSTEQNKTITPWDAIRITVSGTLNSNCFNKNIKFR